jgi:hypothetical protein
MLPAAGVSSAPPNFLAVLAVVVLSVLNLSRYAGCKWNWHRCCLRAWHKNRAKCEREDSACNSSRHVHSLPCGRILSRDTINICGFMVSHTYWRGRPLNAPAAFIHPCRPIVAKQHPSCCARTSTPASSGEEPPTEELVRYDRRNDRLERPFSPNAAGVRPGSSPAARCAFAR